MSVNATKKQLKIRDLSKGLDTYSQANAVPEGYYVDAQNMLLVNKTPTTIGGLTKFNTTACPSGNVMWFEPYTDGSGNTTLLVASDMGKFYEYTVGTDTWRLVRQGLAEGFLVVTHVPFRGQLILSTGQDESPYKFDGDNLLPVGAFGGTQLVSDFEPDEESEWSGGTADTTNHRDQTQGRSIAGVANAFRTYSGNRNFLTGLNGGTNLAATDKFEIKAIRTAGVGLGTVRFRFGNAAGTAYFEATTTVTAGSFTQLSILRSAFTTTGAPNWNSIARFTIFVDTADTITFDDAHWIYATRPPAGSLVEMYNQQLVVGGIPSDLVSVVYSDPGTPDEIPAVNVARFSGGRHALEKVDQITALRAYFDELVVGKVNSAWTFSGTGENTSISALPLTIGIDGHRGIAETPWSLQFSFENNIFGARLTSRGLVSANINSLLATLDGNQTDKYVSLRHDRTRTVRWSFRTTTASPSNQNDLGLIYDYQADAWCCRYTPKISYYTRGIVNGAREILCAQYDGFVRRVDVGADFDGTAIESYIVLPYRASGGDDNQDKVSRWIDATIYLSGSASVSVDARFADEPHEFASATFSSFGTISATPDGDKGYVTLGRTSRWIQLRLRATAGSFTVLLPIIIGYSDTDRRV